MRRQQGAAMVLVALSTSVLLITLGLVANVGLLFLEHARMQAAADAAALAGARTLADGPEAAEAQAVALAKANGYALRSQDVSVGTGQVQVGWQQRHDFLLGALMSQLGVTLSVSADAKLVSLGMRYGLRPFGLPMCPQELEEAKEYALKTGCNPSSGNFQALALEGRGAADYRTLLVRGSPHPFRIGEQVETEPGNMVGPVLSAVQELIGNDATSYDAALEKPDETPRVVTVCLIDPSDWGGLHGRSSVEIKRFAQFYLTRTDSSGAVWARFIRCPDITSVPGTETRYTAKLIE